MGAVNVMTGVYTGRSPKDKFFVMDETTKDTIWWTSPEYKNDNKARDEGCMEGVEEARRPGAFGQEALRGRYLLRRQREHA